MGGPMNQVLTGLTSALDWRLVILAGITCLLTSVVAIGLFQRAVCNHDPMRWGWLTLAAMAGGGGIWATHFIALLAHRLHDPALDDLGPTALSFTIATVFTGAGFWIALIQRSLLTSAVGGLVIGFGIAAMHQVGASAWAATGGIDWQAHPVATSIVLGALSSTAALIIVTSIQGMRAVLAAGALLALSILLVQVIGVTALDLRMALASATGTNSEVETALALAIAAVALAVFGMAFIGVVANGRSTAQRQQMAATEARLIQQNARLDTALNNMGQGLAMFDADGRLVFWNTRYIQFYGLDSKDVRHGMSLEEALMLRQRKGAFDLDPIRHAQTIRAKVQKAEGFGMTFEVAGGRIVEVENQPMADGGWVSTHEDITVRRRAENQLQTQKRQLDAALDTMLQGLVMFDAETRLVICNKRYLQMYRLSPTAVRPGMTLLDILSLRKTHGSFAGDPQVYIANLMAQLADGKPANFTTETPDQRTIAIDNLPLEGGGWVSTHTDITDRIRADQRLREQRLQLDTALNTMTQGLNLLDENGRLVLANERYRKMYRLPPDSLHPGASLEDLVKGRIEAGTFFAVDPQEYMAAMRGFFSRREGGTLTMELTDGRTISMHYQPTAEGKGWVITHEDISERRRVEKERDRSTALASSVIENVPAVIIVKDAKTKRYLLINRAGEVFYGLERRDMIGKTADDIFPSETAARVRDQDIKALAEKRPVFFEEHPSQTPNGETRIVSAVRLPIFDASGDVRYLVSVIEDLTGRKHAEARIAHLAHHDILTGLPNRSAFNSRLEAMLEAVKKKRTPFVVMALDMSRIKEINDVFGYSTGDSVLCEQSRRLHAAVDGAFVARLGGDEFAIIVHDAKEPATAEQVAQNIQSALSEEIVVDGRNVLSGATIGIAIYPQDGEDAATLVANTSAALHRAKAQDRGHYRFFEADMDRQLRDRRAIQQDLSAAIENGELSLHYQPQARVDGAVFGFEALVRWNQAARGNVPPSLFIPLAEDNGAIIPIGEWILREACREAASWPKPLNIAVNLSPIQFRHGDLARLVSDVLKETGLPPQRLELEITEGVLIGDYSRALSILRQLKNIGVRIAMDDFGTGYSSLSYLQAFPFDKIKIDRTFISNLESNPQSGTIVRAVIGLARGFDVPVIAEGVETKAQLSILANEGCDQVQGYLIGRPMPIEDYASQVGRPIPFKRRSAGAEPSA